MTLLWQNVWKYKKVGNHIYEACESTCHECSAKHKVEKDIEDSVIEDADLFKEKDMEKKKMMREKANIKRGSPQYEREFWKGHWSPYELRKNIDEQQDDKKKIKVQWDMDDEDEVKEITAAKNPMKKYASVCDM